MSAGTQAVAIRNSAPEDELRSFLGVSIWAATMTQVVDRVREAIVARAKLHIGVVNAAKVVNMRRDPALGEDVLSSDIVLADGAAVVWASRILRKPLPERVAGIDIMHAVLAEGAKHGWRVYCLGAADDILQRTISEFERLHPGIVIAGSQNGYFSSEQEEAVATAIRDSRADVLFVAITSPKKERFMAKWSALMNVPVVHGVGGSFDVVAGKVKRAPELWQKLGLEWLYRVKQEPGRLWKRYAVTNALFTWMLLKELMFGQHEGGKRQ
jgi:N-acetylglucosaminyldiphosphoundecaprenol N-acetyl-beta-D-mannosaminyltransferase